MKILRELDKRQVLLMATSLLVMIRHWDDRDPEFLPKAENAITDIAFSVGGEDGYQKVLRSAALWEHNGGQKND